VVVFGQAVEEIRPTDVTAGAVEEQQGVAGTAFCHLDTEHAAANGHHSLIVRNHLAITSELWEIFAADV
jgi:hypothetical protein